MTARRRLLVGTGAALVALAGCGSVGRIPDVEGFAGGSARMVDALEATYLSTIELLDSAPLTPELEREHRELAAERRRLQQTWRPLRDGMKALRGYSHTLHGLVSGGVSKQEGASALTTHLEGMLGPVGMIAGPLSGLSAGHELGHLFAEIDRVKRAKRTLRAMHRTLKALTPVVGRFTRELHDDFENLHQWTERVIKLLHEQNEKLHAQELAYEKEMRTQEQLITGQLKAYAAAERAGMQVRSRVHPGLGRVGVRRRHALPVGEDARRLVGKLRHVHGLLHRHHRGFPRGHFVHDLLADLEELGEGAEVFGYLEGLGEHLGHAQASGDAGRLSGYLRRLEGQVDRLAKAVPRQYASHRQGWLEQVEVQGQAVGRIRDELYVFLHQAARVLLVAVEGALASGGYEGCAHHGMVVHLSDALREVEDLKGPQPVGSWPQAVEAELVQLIHKLLPGVLDQLDADLGWLRVLARAEGAAQAPRDQLQAELFASCTMGFSHGDSAGGVDALAARYAERRAGARLLGEDLSMIEVVAKRTGALEGAIGGGGTRAETLHLASRFHRLDAEVQALWQRAAAVAKVAEGDEVLGSGKLTQSRLKAREAYWKGRLKALSEERKVIAEKIEAYAARRKQIAQHHLHIKDLLHKGRGSLDHWGEAHQAMAAGVGGKSAPAHEAFVAAVDAHHEAVATPLSARETAAEGGEVSLETPTRVAPSRGASPYDGYDVYGSSDSADPYGAASAGEAAAGGMSAMDAGGDASMAGMGGDASMDSMGGMGGMDSMGGDASMGGMDAMGGDASMGSMGGDDSMGG